MASKVGLSSSYFATRGIGIYESVEKARELGFKQVELGAAHKFEKGLWETIKKIKHDFPDLNYTVHGLFPPLEERFWFNAALGLTKQNRRVLDEMFRAAEIVEAEVVGIHPGFPFRLGFAKGPHGFSKMEFGERIEKEKAIAGLKEVLVYGTMLAANSGATFAIENMPSGHVECVLDSADAFKEIFHELPDIKLLLDFGHALLAGNLNEMMNLRARVCEMHVHYSSGEMVNGMADHHAFPEGYDFSILRGIRHLKELPLIFEHGTNVSESEVLREKKGLEQFIESLE